jgi:hypothetical protein
VTEIHTERVAEQAIIVIPSADRTVALDSIG